MVTWAEILWSSECSACGSRVKRSELGPSRAFCPTCTANLPDLLALHLDRAIRQSWFLAWWRIATRELRRSALVSHQRVETRAQTQGTYL